MDILVIVIVVGLALVGWALVDVWRRSDEPIPFKWGWSLLALGGQFTAPGWRFADGWYAAIPLGAIAYLTLARSGPLRRRGERQEDGGLEAGDQHRTPLEE